MLDIINDIKWSNKLSPKFSNGSGSLEVIGNFGESIFSRDFQEKSDGARNKWEVKKRRWECRLTTP